MYPDPVTMASGSTMTLSALQNWNKTEAPSRQWRNYRRASSGNYEPYLPGVGLYKHSSNHEYLEEGLSGLYNSFIAGSPNALSAGVDCVGFAKRSASYNDAAYTWGKVSGNITEGAATDEREDNTYPYVGVDSYLVSSDEKLYEDEETGLPNFLGLEKLVPGDVFYYRQQDDSIHIAIVQEVEYSKWLTKYG